MENQYTVTIIQRDGMGQVRDDFHATMRRESDGVELISISAWRWLLNWKTRRSAVEKAFVRYDKQQAKMAEVHEKKL
jgi:hypothetical protein